MREAGSGARVPGVQWWHGVIPQHKTTWPSGFVLVPGTELVKPLDSCDCANEVTRALESFRWASSPEKPALMRGWNSGPAPNLREGRGWRLSQSAEASDLIKPRHPSRASTKPLEDGAGEHVWGVHPSSTGT